MPPARLCLTLLFSTVSLGQHSFSYDLLYLVGDSYFLSLEMTLSTFSLLSDFHTEGLERAKMEQRRYLKGPGEIIGRSHMGTGYIAGFYVPPLKGREVKKRNKLTEILTAYNSMLLHFR